LNITSRQLKAFLLTARFQSFSRAAEELCITQSGMSVLVRELESQLGFRLFDRTTRRVALTEFGVRFLPVAERSLVSLESAAMSIGRAASDPRRRLCIGATPLVAADFLAPAAAQFMKANPGVEIRVLDADRARLVDMVQWGEIDAGIAPFIGEAAGAQRVPLARFSLMLVRARTATGACAPRARWAEIVPCTLVGRPPDHPIQALVDERLQREGRHQPPEIVCNHRLTQIAMVETGAGVAVLPTLSIPGCLARKLTLQAIVDPVVSSELFWVASRARKLPAAAERFCGYLKDFVAGWTERWPPAQALEPLSATAR
jgi:DNA-binding transcriptional LysR family regulator